MMNEGMSVTLLKHQLEENHDGKHQESHPQKMMWTEHDPISYEWELGNQQHDAPVISSHKEVCSIYQTDLGPI